MRVLFTADLHIRLGQKNIPKKWAINRYNILWSELDRVFDEYGCVKEIHGGDLFDRIPTLEELAIYLNYVSTRDRNFIAFDGNHEATKRKATFLHYIKDLLKECGVQLVDEPLVFPGMGDIIPYTHIKTRNLNKWKRSDILFTHVRGEIPPHVTPEIDLKELEAWTTVFAGDLHAHSNSQRNIIYPGSPVTVIFHRNKVKTGVIVVETDTGEWEWVEIDVPQLIRKTIESPEDMIKTKYDHTIYEVVGDMVELSKIDKNIDILDKKIVKYESEVALDLTDLSLEDEIYLYLMDIMQLDNSKIQNILKVYNDNIKGIDLE
jgi:hypothetical protein